MNGSVYDGVRRVRDWGHRYLKMILRYFVLILIPYTESACSFPLSAGSWTDSKYGTVQFSGSTMFMSQRGYGTGATSTNWTCDTASGSRYLARTTSTVILNYGSIGNLQLYLYICMDITMVTQYSYYYYQQTEDSVDLGRMKGSVTATYLMSDVCTTTISAELFQVLVKQGSETSAMTTCPSLLLGSFRYIYYDGSTHCGSGSEWDGCTDSSRVKVNYTLCSRTVAYSAGGELGCVVSIQSGSSYYVGLYNFDTTVDGAATRRYTCLTLSSGTYLNISQSPDHCQASQSAHVVPTSGALLSLTQLVSCAPTTSSNSEDNTLVIVLSVLVPSFIIYVVVVLILYVYRRIYWKRRMQRKTVIIPKELPTSGDQLLAESETTTDVNAAIRRESTRVPELTYTRPTEERRKQMISNTNARLIPRYHPIKRAQKIDKMRSNQYKEMLNASQVYSRNTTPHSQYNSSIISRQSLLSRSNKASGGSIKTLTNGSLYSEIRPSLRSMSSVRLSVYSLFSRQETKSPVSSGLGLDDGRNSSPDPEINNQNRNYTFSGISKTSTNRVFPASQNQNVRTEPQVPSLYDFVMAEG